MRAGWSEVAAHVSRRAALNSAALVECGIQPFLGHDDGITALQVTVGANFVKASLNDMIGLDLVHHLGSLADVMLSTDAKSKLGACVVVADCDQRQEDELCGAVALLSSSDTPVPLQWKECFTSGSGRQKDVSTSATTQHCHRQRRHRHRGCHSENCHRGERVGNHERHSRDVTVSPCDVEDEVSVPLDS